jgi:hypothetical protein
MKVPDTLTMIGVAIPETVLFMLYDISCSYQLMIMI